MRCVGSSNLPQVPILRYYTWRTPGTTPGETTPGNDTWPAPRIPTHCRAISSASLDASVDFLFFISFNLNIVFILIS